MTTRLATLKEIALQGMNICDFLASQGDSHAGDCSFAQRCGESNPAAIERARRARARAAAEFSRQLCRLQRARQAVQEAPDMAALSASLARLDIGGDDDLSIHLRRMRRMVDRPE